MFFVRLKHTTSPSLRLAKMQIFVLIFFLTFQQPNFPFLPPVGYIVLFVLNMPWGWSLVFQVIPSNKTITSYIQNWFVLSHHSISDLHIYKNSLNKCLLQIITIGLLEELSFHCVYSMKSGSYYKLRIVPCTSEDTPNFLFQPHICLEL